jgi:Na+-driven multidrug efflux pump
MKENNTSQLVVSVIIVCLGTLSTLGSVLVSSYIYKYTLDPTGVAFAGVSGYLISSLTVISYLLLNKSPHCEGINIVN